MPNICYVVNTLQPAGAENQILDIIEHAPAEFDFTVAHFGWELTLEEEFRNADASLLNLDFSYPYDPKGMRKLRSYCKHEVDVIHAHLPSSILVSRIASVSLDVPLISTHHNVPDNYSSFSRALELLTRPLDNVTVAVSEGVAIEHTHLPGDNWKTIHNGIEVDEYRSRVQESDPERVRDRWNIESDTVFLNIARYSPQKRQVDIVRAMELVVKELDSCHLVLVGWGDDKSTIQSVVEDLGLTDSVTITDRVPEVYPYYALADVFVSASTREGLPITFLEAMSAGVPIVGTDIPGIREIVIDGETGRLVSSKNPSELAQAMLEVTKRESATPMGENGYQRAKLEFDINSTIEEHVELYKQLTAK